MRKLILIVLLACTSLFAYAQEQESVPPVIGKVHVAKRCNVMNIEGYNFFNVTVFMKTNNPDYVFVTEHKVRVTVKQGKKNVYHRTFRNAYLYVFRNGQVQVGRPRFNQMIIQRQENGDVVGIIRELEGIYM